MFRLFSYFYLHREQIACDHNLYGRQLGLE
jgi:hypothetical protein